MQWQQLRLAVWILIFRVDLDIFRRIVQGPRVHAEVCRIHPRRRHLLHNQFDLVLVSAWRDAGQNCDTQITRVHDTAH